VSSEARVGAVLPQKLRFLAGFDPIGAKEKPTVTNHRSP